MLKRFLSRFSGGANAQVQTSIKGDGNHIFNLVLQGGAAQALPMRETLWNEDPQVGGGVAALLQWNTRLTQLMGRDMELDALRVWLAADYSVSFKLLHAPGGQGKSRLAAELTRELQGWRHSWVDLSEFDRTEALSWQGRCLLIVDCPDYRKEQLEGLARAIARSTVTDAQKLRVLLLARESQTIVETLQSTPSVGWLSESMRLPELPAQVGFDLLSAALVRLMGRVSQISWADFEAWRETSFLHHSPLFVMALAVDLSARPLPWPPCSAWLGGTALLRQLMKREASLWEKTEQGCGAPAGSIKTVMGWATLSGALSDAQINKVLATAYGWNSAALGALHEALIRGGCVRSAPHGWEPVKPDLLAAQFITDWCNEPEGQGYQERDAALAQALLLAVESADFRVHLNRLHMLAYDQSIRVDACAPDAPHSLQTTLWQWSQHSPMLRQALCQRVVERVKWPGFPALPVRLLQQSLPHHTTKAERAAHLNSLALFIAASGNQAGALAPAREAVDIYRGLARAGAADFRPHLARSLTNLAICVAGTGNRVGALALLSEAADIYRPLVKASAVSYENELASCLSNLASCMGEMGDQEAALATAHEVVEIRRRLVKVNALAYEPHLASGLNIQATCMLAAGERARALVLACEAVEIFRRLALSNAAAYEPELAICLNILAICMAETGDREGSLATAREVVEIHRRLVKANALAYEQNLAGNLSNLANRMAATGDQVGALAPAREAVEIYRRLTMANAAAHEPELASGLNNLASWMAETGDHEGALALAREVVEIRRRLVNSNAAAHESKLASGLNNLANRMVDTVSRVGALAPAREAVEIYRRLANANAAAYEPDLAFCLWTLARCEEAAGHKGAAIGAIDEALAKLSPWAHAFPDLYGPQRDKMAQELADLRAV